jgi:ATP-binding cassette subfamily F protein 3
MLEVNKLQLFFGDRAIANNISFSLHRKERVGLVGLNGAGKSTLLKLIAGELTADGGEASLEKGATLGYLHQDLNSLSGKSIREEV